MSGTVDRWPGYRASDAEREVIAGIVRRAHIEGRFSAEELEAELGRVYAARTYGALDALLRDLPVSLTEAEWRAVYTGGAGQPVAAGAVQPPTPVDRAARNRRRRRTRGLVVGWIGWGVLTSAWLIVWLTGHAFWPFWVLVPWGAVMVGHTISASVDRRALEPSRQRQQLR